MTLAPLLEEVKLQIKGEKVNSVSRETYEVRNPATSELLAVVAKANREDAKAAIDAAQDALKKWSATTPIERAKILLRASEIVASMKDEIGRLITLENGKPLADATREAEGAANRLAGEAYDGVRLFGEVSQNHPGVYAIRKVQPIGVCGILLPFNNPAGQWCSQIPFGLALGNTLVVKPSSTTPLAEAKLNEAVMKAGLPPGVLNFVPGPGATVGEELVTNPKTRMISLTGEYATGVRVMQAAAPEMKRLTLELGGSDPLIVCDDGDIDAAVTYGVQNRFRNTGQGCMCSKRIFVFESVYDTYLRKYLEEARKWNLGNGMDAGTKVGPVHTASGRATIERQVNDAVNKGAKVELGGKKPVKKELQNGFFFEPTVLTNASYDSAVAREETFGPAVPIWKVKDISEAIERANDTRYGLTGSIFTRDIRKANKFVEEYISAFNRVNPGPGTDFQGFGRVYVKHSGFGAEGVDAYVKRTPAVINASWPGTAA